ncbi:hypothetical protein [Chitinophaga nivalis]|uniref:Lipoprotein n=1 Tax=Chitinophaga nivalis TaxID=2991709 RepID=A0ABT3IIQ2_9BACT|nr:hypothetical protein [Chitinophaga nivalis]MCW3466461.1 hypothetical protein [Chitinophaga nivalis]MCW3483848.1 hypothetical protein [Chitinophaga nivalis]
MNLKQQVMAFMVTGMALVSCGNGASDAASCKTAGVVKDMSTLDGCGLMIELKDGTQLNPVEFATPGFALKAGQQVKFDYTELTDHMTACMGGKTVRIECIQEVK